MPIKDILRRLIRPTPTTSSTDSTGRSPERDREELAKAAWANAYLEAMEAGRLCPPRDVHDAAGWDTYWSNHLEVGAPDQGFCDMMGPGVGASSDERLVELLTTRDVQTILCAGNGLSSEAVSLALHGFQVTALDISALVASTMAATLRLPAHPVARIPGVRFTDTAVIFEDAGEIPSELCPTIHQSISHPPRAGGALIFATGDLMDPDVSPGPYDAVIERRTVQLFPDEEVPVALDRLASRLSERGLFVSHLHDGQGSPRGHRPDHARTWAESRGFTLDSATGAETRRTAARLACLRLSTG